MASNYWIKLYHETLDDPKMGRLTDRQYRRVIELFLLAGDYEKDGVLPPFEDIEFRLRSPEGLKEDLEILMKCEIISIDEQNRYYITRWEDRQGAMTSTERTQRWREAQRKEGYYGNKDGTIRPIDKEEDIDVEEIKNREDVEGNNAPQDLITTFTDYTKLKPGSNAEKIAADLVSAGVICEDVIKAVDFLNGSDKYKCVSFKSVQESAIYERNKRIGRNKENNREDYRRYIKGEHGEFGNY